MGASLRGGAPGAAGHGDGGSRKVGDERARTTRRVEEQVDLQTP